MTLREKQSVFAILLASLIHKAYALGFEVTLGEAYRPPETAAFYAKAGIGITGSLHTLKLAIDLNLFKNGKWLRKTSDHAPLGEYWESLSTPDYKCTWGGRFGDGNHYSIAHNGRK